MLYGLLATALLMGLAGSPHCIAMCGAASAGIGHTQRRMWSFQAGRMAGYALLGGAVAASAGVLQWSAQNVALIKPFWAMLHVAVGIVGSSLLWLGRQPAWLDRAAHRVWQALRSRMLLWDTGRGPALAGLLWALLPCGLLYSALMLAALGSQPWHGALVMAVFAAGSGAALQLGPALLHRVLRSRSAGSADASRWSVRLAGLALAGASAWALVHGMWHDLAALLCTSPAG